MSLASGDFDPIFNKYVETGDLSLRDKACEILIKKHSIILPFRKENFIKEQSYPWDPIDSIASVDSFMTCKSEDPFGSGNSILILTNQAYVKAPIFKDYSNYIGRFSSVCGAIAMSKNQPVHSVNVNGKMLFPLQLIRDLLAEYHSFLPMQDLNQRGKPFMNFIEGKANALVSVEGKKLITSNIESMLRFWVQGMTDIKSAILCVGTHDISEPPKVIINIATNNKETCRFIWDRFKQDLPQLRNEATEIVIIATPLNTCESRFKTEDGEAVEDCIIKIM